MITHAGQQKYVKLWKKAKIIDSNLSCLLFTANIPGTTDNNVGL